MANKVEDLVNVILDSYNECDITARIDEENMLNKDILIEIIDEIRKIEPYWSGVFLTTTRSEVNT